MILQKYPIDFSLKICYTICILIVSMSPFDQIKQILASAHTAFAEFMRDLLAVKKEEQDVLVKAHALADQKKIDIIKNRINNLK